MDSYEPKQILLVYIITNKINSTLYIGMCNNLERRMYEHKHKLYAGFSSKYNLGKLVYFESYYSASEAILREKQLKNWHRDWKINLIKEENPDFNDLSKDWEIFDEDTDEILNHGMSPWHAKFRMTLLVNKNVSTII